MYTKLLKCKKKGKKVHTIVTIHVIISGVYERSEGASNCSKHLQNSKYGQNDGFKISVPKWVGNYWNLVMSNELVQKNSQATVIRCLVQMK